MCDVVWVELCVCCHCCRETLTAQKIKSIVTTDRWVLQPAGIGRQRVTQWHWRKAFIWLIKWQQAAFYCKIYLCVISKKMQRICNKWYLCVLQLLHEEWANYGACCKYQPMDLIRYQTWCTSLSSGSVKDVIQHTDGDSLVVFSENCQMFVFIFVACCK